MAKIEKANSVGEWFDQRLNITALNKVMMTEYWIPKISTSYGQWGFY